MNTLVGIKESDTGLAPPSQWDLVADKQMLQEEQALQVARCTKIINAGQDDAKYMVSRNVFYQFGLNNYRLVSLTQYKKYGVDYGRLM